MTRRLWLSLLAAPMWGAGPSLKIQVRNSQGRQVVEAPLEKYVAAVLAGEVAVFKSEEALKAMAVAVRTYGLRLRGRHASEGFDLCSTTHCQRVDLAAATPRLEAMAAATAGELLWYLGKLAFTPYSRDCGGRTESAEAVWHGSNAPYLSIRDDVYCVRAGSPAWRWSADALKIAEALKRSQLKAPAVLQRIAVAQRSESGRALTLLLEGGGEALRITASTFRFAMGREIAWNTVQSDSYEVHEAGGRLLFDGRGSGHGVGMCQRGAEQMGAEGRSYRDILAYYYAGTEVGSTARGLAWQRLGGESIALFTTRPSLDGAVLAAAERELRAAAQRTNWTPPPNIELRIYPDVESFRNATGEPGWVAAHTVGRRIELQPARLLRTHGGLDRTLRHELLHVLVESQTKAALPLWFREGLVEYLTGGVTPGAVKPPSDADLQQTADPARARKAYTEAAQAVMTLTARHGEATVLEWVKRGMPESGGRK